MRVAENVTPLELADYQKAVRLVLRQPLITAVHPDAGALPLVRRWAEQLRTDLHEVLGYTLVTTGGHGTAAPGPGRRWTRPARP